MRGFIAMVAITAMLVSVEVQALSKMEHSDQASEEVSCTIGLDVGSVLELTIENNLSAYIDQEVTTVQVGVGCGQCNGPGLSTCTLPMNTAQLFDHVPISYRLDPPLDQPGYIGDGRRA